MADGSYYTLNSSQIVSLIFFGQPALSRGASMVPYLRALAVADASVGTTSDSSAQVIVRTIFFAFQLTYNYTF